MQVRATLNPRKQAAWRRHALFPVDVFASTGWRAPGHLVGSVRVAALPAYGWSSRALIPLPQVNGRSLADNVPLLSWLCLWALLVGFWYGAIRPAFSLPAAPVAALSAVSLQERLGGGIASAAAVLRAAAAVFPDSHGFVLGRANGRTAASDWWTFVEVDGRLLRSPADAETLEAALDGAGFTLADGDRILVVAVTGAPLGEMPFYAAPAAVPELVLGAPPPIPLSSGAGEVAAGRPGVRLFQPLSGVVASFVQLPKLKSPTSDPRLPVPVQPARLAVQRAVPFSVDDGGMPTATRAAAATVGEALRIVGVEPFPEDLLLPAPDTPLSVGLRVTIWRATPVTITGKDLNLDVRSRAATVGELLAERGVALGPLDRVDPEVADLLEPYGTVRIVRVHEEEIEDLRVLPYDTRYQHDAGLPTGWRQRVQAGVAGLARRVMRLLYEDGELAAQQVVASTVLREARPEIIRYGPGVFPPWQAGVLPARAALAAHPAEVAGYRVRQVLLMEATAYDPGPASTGKWPGQPGYGITASGMRAGYGVVAIDPRVIPFYTRVYVPSYGFGIAGDTGGAIKGLRIDVGFSTYAEAIHWGRRLVPVYILE